jgi:phosphoribosylanthranilate isomerase
MTRVKICGIMNSDDLAIAIQAGADAVGFVTEIEDSRHCISAEKAADLIHKVPVYTKSVAVVHPRDVDEALRLAELTGADVLQLHSLLPPADIMELKNLVRQMLVVAVAADDGGQEAQRYESVADAVLLDSMVGGRLGGTGKVHDWDKSAGITRSLRVPVILAGGLDADNVLQAIERVRPYAVDVSSGTETAGIKDPLKVRAFIEKVRRCPVSQ